jgi:hypothetical protein
MRTLRRVHLYLGCFFTPALCFFAVTGAWQNFDFHKTLKGGSYVAPAWMAEMSRLHMSQKSLQPGVRAPGSAFGYFALAAAAGLVTTSILGVIMAFTLARRKWTVVACLAAGVLVPWWLAYG